MKLFIDNIVFDLQKIGGISVYWSEIIKRIYNSDHEVTFVEQDNKTSNICRRKIEINSSNIICQKKISTLISRYLPVNLNIDIPFIFHSSYYRVCKNPKAVNVITVYDFIYEFFESGFKKKIHMLQKKYALNNADAVICISESTKSDLLQLYPDLSPEKVRVIYIAAGNDFYPLEKKLYSVGPYENILSKKYILYIGGRGSYKNFKVAVDVVSQLNGYSLVIVGGGELTASENCNLSSISGRFFHVKSPSSSDINVLYNHAFCLLYPSSYEGFGIPIAEAMKAGCPVITSLISSIPEVAGSAGLIVETICPAEIISKINDLNDESFRYEVVERGLIQGNKFSWDRCFSETLECYEHAYNNKFNLF